MCAGIKFSEIKVEKGVICDGHHRYIASLLAGTSIEKITTNTTSATIVTSWESVTFEEQDWDTHAKIKMLNEQDALYNNITIEEVVKLLN